MSRVWVWLALNHYHACMLASCRLLGSLHYITAGLVATVAALSTGLVAFKNGNAAMSQTMMRLRVLAQGSTIIALLGGMAVAARKKPG